MRVNGSNGVLKRYLGCRQGRTLADIGTGYHYFISFSERKVLAGASRCCPCRSWGRQGEACHRPELSEERRYLVRCDGQVADDYGHGSQRRWGSHHSLRASLRFVASIKSLEEYCAEFLIHAADNEGLQKGVDEELVRKLAEWCSIPVTYAGGGRDLQDLDHVKTLSGTRVDLTIGSALDIFGGSGVTFDECVQWNRSQSRR